jgi:hypothetical protein
MIPTKYLDHRRLGITALRTGTWTFRSSHVLKICKEADWALYGMLICDIVRYITLCKTTLSCTLPKGSGSVTINIIRWSRTVEAQTLEFNPEKSIEVQVVKWESFELFVAYIWANIFLINKAMIKLGFEWSNLRNNFSILPMIRHLKHFVGLIKTIGDFYSLLSISSFGSLQVFQPFSKCIVYLSKFIWNSDEISVGIW